MQFSALGVVSALAVSAMAFAIGFAIRRGSICLVDASHQWVVNQRSLRLRAFAVAAAAAGCAILPLAWLLPERITLAPSYPLTIAILLSGGLFGIGARINGGCAFGTLAQLSGGRVNFTGTLVGAAIGAYAIAGTVALGEPAVPLFAQPDIVGLAALVVCLVFALPVFKKRHLQNLAGIIRNPRALLRPFTAMLLIGLLGGILFATAGSWTHLSVIQGESAYAAGDIAPDSGSRAILGASALFAGAVFAAWRSGRFQVEWPSLRQWLLCCCGGGLMGAAAALIPGGNGALIVFGIPSGSTSALGAVAAMICVLCLSFVPQRLSRRMARHVDPSVTN